MDTRTETSHGVQSFAQRLREREREYKSQLAAFISHLCCRGENRLCLCYMCDRCLPWKWHSTTLECGLNESSGRTNDCIPHQPSSSAAASRVSDQQAALQQLYCNALTDCDVVTVYWKRAPLLLQLIPEHVARLEDKNTAETERKLRYINPECVMG